MWYGSSQVNYTHTLKLVYLQKDILTPELLLLKASTKQRNNVGTRELKYRLCFAISLLYDLE